MESDKIETESLLENLCVGLPTIALKADIPTPKWNTLNPYFGAEDITEIVDWPEFNYNTIIHRYGGILNSKKIDCVDFSAPWMHTEVWHKSQLDTRLDELVRPHIIRTLRAAFEELEPQTQQLNLNPVTFGHGTTAITIGLFWPDTSFTTVAEGYAQGKNRAPGVLGISPKWSSEWRHSKFSNDQHHFQYNQTLAELNFYMDGHGARCGYVLTDAELVVVKRLDTNGRLAVSAPIPWKTGGNGQLSVRLGLWYLGMLAAEEENWAL
ncbi:uncharacterized protein N7483_010047 [Penicillium malachiteum]|uniref:uncharacterized protein n=1 Tax=Penicillium malachiteum TaxID=1324776 RepID=UPI00254783B2|nr:uncharacterized protein N7483_010047 [Penicillium malachiteum]KAJ5712866.1 hypothetical protein N7483_010047 [Penicillium malachiteum]